jgi:hypothetical protein
MNRAFLAAVTAAALAGAAPGQAPPPEPAQVPGDKGGDQTYKRLAEAERKRLAGKPADAADEVQKVLDEAGDDLVSADKVHYVPARVAAQQVLARLPAEVLRAYRDRADEPARRLLEAGRAARDPRPLRTVLDRYFVSRPAEDALLLLGELAFERGEFRAAEGYWRRLLPADGPGEPPFPTRRPTGRGPGAGGTGRPIRRRPRPGPGRPGQAQSRRPRGGRPAGRPGRVLRRHARGPARPAAGRPDRRRRGRRVGDVRRVPVPGRAGGPGAA